MSSHSQELVFLTIAYQPNVSLQHTADETSQKQALMLKLPTAVLQKRPFSFLSQRLTALNLLRETPGG